MFAIFRAKDDKHKEATTKDWERPSKQWNEYIMTEAEEHDVAIQVTMMILNKAYECVPRLCSRAGT